jgi:hypothetical protein
MSLNKITLRAFEGKTPQPFTSGKFDSDYNYNEKKGYSGPALVRDFKLPSPRKDFGYDQRSEASGADSYYRAANIKGALYKRMEAETPQSDLKSYLNWVPQKEKFNLASIQNHQKSLSN